MVPHANMKVATIAERKKKTRVSGLCNFFLQSPYKYKLKIHVLRRCSVVKRVMKLGR